MTQADEIRRYAVRHYVEPAREAGERRVSIPVGKLHAAMGFNSRVPAVCSALRVEKFQVMANLELKGHSGPCESTKTTFHYRVR